MPSPISRRDTFKAAALVTVAPAALPAANRALDAAGSGTVGVPQRFRVDPFWPQPLPRDPETGRFWVTGEVGGTAVDSRDHLFVCVRRNLTEKEQRAASPSPALMEFDAKGVLVNYATPPVLPDDVHGCFVDHEGNVWIGGSADAIVQKYSHDLGSLLLQIGEKGNFDQTNMSRTLLNEPADVAVDPGNGEIYIADGHGGNRRVVVFDREGNYLRQWGSQGTLAEARAGVGGKFLREVHAVNLGNDGLVYVNDRKGNRVQVFEKDGTFLHNIWINRGHGLDDPAVFGTSWDIAFSPDRDQRLIYVADGEEELIWTVDHETRNAFRKYGRPGHLAGEFTFVHTLAADSKGNIYTAETIGGRRIQKFKVTGAHR